ncbi:MAG: DegT/DnrJ/EryC1/StrS family aminotransferase [Hyphomicrobiales bacterium]
MFNRGRWPYYDEDEIDAAADCLRRADVNALVGSEVDHFEKEYAHWTGAHHAIAVANGTVALDLALWGLGLPKGSEVIVTPRSYVASASCVVNAGLIPVFADVDPDSGNLTAQTIEASLSDQTSAILLVHLNGCPCDMDPILALAKRQGLRVIEDCAQAHGARYRGRSVGTLGDVGAWSFCQDKIMSTGGEGGMVTCNDPALAERMWMLKDHGKNRAAMEGNHPPGFRWVVETFGTNWRLTGPQAAIGRQQLRKLEAWIARRQIIVHRLCEALEEFSCVQTSTETCAGCGTVCDAPNKCRHAYYRLQTWLVPEKLKEGWTQDRLVDALNVVLKGDALHGPCPEIYRESAFKKAGFQPREGRLSIAASLEKTSLLFKIYPTMTDEQLDAYAHAIAAVFRKASEDDA